MAVNSSQNSSNGVGGGDVGSIRVSIHELKKSESRVRETPIGATRDEVGSDYDDYLLQMSYTPHLNSPVFSTIAKSTTPKLNSASIERVRSQQ